MSRPFRFTAICRRLVSAVTLFMALHAVAAAAPAETLEGYLMPFKCQHDDKASHSRACALRSECMITGYGIALDQGDAFVQFDRESNEKAIRVLRQTTKDKDLKAVAEGYRVGTLFHVTALRLK
jgi:hypothetical protein